MFQKYSYFLEGFMFKDWIFSPNFILIFILDLSIFHIWRWAPGGAADAKSTLFNLKTERPPSRWFKYLTRNDYLYNLYNSLFSRDDSLCNRDQDVLFRNVDESFVS